MAIVGIGLVSTYVFSGGLASLIHIDFSSGDGHYFGYVLGRLLVALFGVILVYYAMKGLFKGPEPSAFGSIQTESRTKKVVRWTLTIFLVLFAVLILWVAYGQIWQNSEGDRVISGNVRAGVVEGSVKSCTETISGSPNYTSVSPATVASYCSCYSNKIADTITNTELAEISANGSVPASMQERIKTAETACQGLLTH